MAALVSVILPCYNAGDHLHLALKSMLQQSHRELQIICINDGSTDHTAQILKHYQQSDSRIEIIDHGSNRGLVAALNTGLARIKGEYFARMDQDDFSVPERIQRQLDFMEKHRSLELISSGYHYFVMNGKPQEYVPPIATDSDALNILSAFSTPFCHPALFGRSALVSIGKYRYDPAAEHCEDFELFSRLSGEGVVMGNIHEPLHWLRKNSGSLSVVYFNNQVRAHTTLAARNMGKYMQALPAKQNVWKVVCNRFDTAVSLDELKEGIQLLRDYVRLRLKEVDKAECSQQVHDYLSTYITNIVLQANKKRFSDFGAGNLPFWLASLPLLPARGYAAAIKKLGNKFKFRS